MSLQNKIPEKLLIFEPILRLIPQLAITATMLGLLTLLIFLAPQDVYMTFPMIIFLIFYWIKKIKEIKS